MTKHNEEKRDVDPIKWFGMFLSFLPSLILKSGWSFLHFKQQAKKGGKVFKKELINQGLDKKTAAELTQNYVEGSELIRSLMMNFR